MPVATSSPTRARNVTTRALPAWMPCPIVNTGWLGLAALTANCASGRMAPLMYLLTMPAYVKPAGRYSVSTTGVPQVPVPSL
ncbi:MAG: hypothetical protein BWZ02_01659 [Lentisphaerae bacterium ADurb.BinA184]|nr:MAG: hypothetical protein BWZ02_01659 [Lentisphaerae bacterium ADurb.BinA184]